MVHLAKLFETMPPVLLRVKKLSLWGVLLLGAIFRVAYAATWGHADVWVHAATEGHVWACGPTVAVVCANVHGPCWMSGQCCRLRSCLQVSIYAATLKPCWYPWSGLVCGPTAARGCFCGLCCHQKWHDPCSHWPWRARRLLLLWGRDMECFCNKHYLPTSPQSNCIDRKPSKRSLKKCDGCWSVALYSSSILEGVQEGRIQFYLRSCSLGVCSCSSE